MAIHVIGQSANALILGLVEMPAPRATATPIGGWHGWHSAVDSVPWHADGTLNGTGTRSRVEVVPWSYVVAHEFSTVLSVRKYDRHDQSRVQIS